MLSGRPCFLDHLVVPGWLELRRGDWLAVVGRLFVLRRRSFAATFLAVVGLLEGKRKATESG